MTEPTKDAEAIVAYYGGPCSASMDIHPRIRCAYTPEGNIEAVQRDEPTWRVVVDCRDGNVIAALNKNKPSAEQFPC